MDVCDKIISEVPFATLGGEPNGDNKQIMSEKKKKKHEDEEK